MLTRRNFLRNTTRDATAIGVALSSVGLWSPGAHADAAITKDQAGYRDSPNGSQQCALCKKFKPPGACSLVSGPVNPQGWCHFFSVTG
jgi:hypothetical protein